MRTHCQLNEELYRVVACVQAKLTRKLLVLVLIIGLGIVLAHALVLEFPFCFGAIFEALIVQGIVALFIWYNSIKFAPRWWRLWRLWGNMGMLRG